MTDHSTSSERAPPRPPARRRSPVQPHLIPAAAHGRTLMQLRAAATVCTPYAPWSALLSRLRLSVILAMWSLGTSHDGRGFDDALESGGYAVGVVVGAKVDLEARAVGHAEGGQHLTSDPTNLVDDLTVSVEVDLHRVVALVERDADHIPTLHRPERLQTAGQRPRCRRLVLSHHTHRSTLANGRQADRAGWWVRVSAAVASAWLITQSSGVSLVASPTAKVPGCTMVTSKYACKGCAKGAHKAYFRGLQSCNGCTRHPSRCTMVTLSCKTGESPRMDPLPETTFPCTCTPPALSLSLNPITGSNATSGGSGTPQQQPITCTGDGMHVWSELAWGAEVRVELTAE